MNTGNGLSVAALIMAVIGGFVPGIGLYIGWAALVLATFGAIGGAKGLTVAVVAVSAMIFLFLTPSLWAEAAMHQAGFGEATGAPPFLRIGTLVALALPFVGMMLAPSLSPER